MSRCTQGVTLFTLALGMMACERTLTLDRAPSPDGSGSTAPPPKCESEARPLSRVWEVPVEKHGPLVGHGNANVTLFHERKSAMHCGTKINQGLTWTTLSSQGAVVASGGTDDAFGAAAAPEYGWLGAAAGPSGLIALTISKPGIAIPDCYIVAGEFGAATYDAPADRFETGIVGGSGFAEMVPDSAGNLAILQTLDPFPSSGTYQQLLKRQRPDGTVISSVPLSELLGPYQYASSLVPASGGDVLLAVLTADSPVLVIVRVSDQGEIVAMHPTPVDRSPDVENWDRPWLAVDGSDNIYLAGRADWSGTYGETYRVVVAKLDPHGNTLWEWRAPSPDADPETYFVEALRVDASGHAWLLTKSRSQSGRIQRRVHHLTADGELCASLLVGDAIVCVPGQPCDVDGPEVAKEFTVGPSGEMTFLMRTAEGEHTILRAE